MPEEPIITHCTECKGTFTFAACDLGALSACPHCQTNLILHRDWSAPGNAPHFITEARQRKLKEIRAASAYPRNEPSLIAGLSMIAGSVAFFMAFRPAASLLADIADLMLNQAVKPTR